MITSGGVKARALASMLFVALCGCSPASPATPAPEAAASHEPLPPPDLTAQSAQCQPRWSGQHDLLSTDGRPVHVQRPSLAVLGDSMLLVGTPSYFWATEDSFDPTPGPRRADTVEYVDRISRNHSYVGMQLDADMRATGVRFPARLRGLVEHAVVARDSGGTVHLYWMNPPGDSTALWHARREGNDWSLQERLFSAMRLRWADADVRASADMHVIVPFLRPRGAGVTYLRDGDEVSRTVLHFHDRVLHATVLPFARDSLLIAYTAVDTTQSPHGTHLFVIRASSRDTLLAAARRVHTSAGRLARFPRLFSEAAHGSMRFGILWVSARAEGRDRGDSVHVMLSSDARRWTAPVSQPLPVRASHLSIVTPAGKGVQGIAWIDARQPMILFGWRGGAWRGPVALPFRDVAGTPSLMTARGDSLLLMWGIARQSRVHPPEMPRAAATRYAWIDVSCP